MDSSLTVQYRQVHYERGVVYSGAGQYEQAIKNFTKAIDLDPDSAIVYYDRGIAYQNLKDYDNAIEDFEEYLELVPNARNKEDVLERLGKLREELKNPKPKPRWIGLTKADAVNRRREYRQTVAKLTKEIETNPDNIATYYDRGVAYENLNDYKKAHADFKKYLELAPDAENKHEVLMTLRELEEELK
jgi:regulator of sirC expression with transglutaminase-like and TPR domain